MNETEKIRYELFFPSELNEAIARTPVAYLPAGSLEWHGEHLALGSDYLRGHEICLRAARLTGGIVLPPIYVAAAGYSAYHGSIVFSAKLVTDFALELLRELEKIGFQTAVIVLGHGGCVQQDAFEKAADIYQQANQMQVLVVAPESLVELPAEAGGHAGAYETAQLLAAAPEAVDLSRFDPTATRLPKYEGINREPYKQGTSSQGSDDIDDHMSAKEWSWQQNLPELVNPQDAEQWMSKIAEAVAEQVKEETSRLE